MNHTATPSDVATAAIIASTGITNSTAAIAIIGWNMARAAFVATAAAVKAIRLPTKINGCINDKGTATNQITQDQANKIYRIQEILDKYATLIEGISSFLKKNWTSRMTHCPIRRKR